MSQRRGAALAGEDDKFDWRGPLLKAAELIYIVALDAVAVFVIAVIANLLELGFNFFTRRTINWTFGEVTVSLSEIMHYGDLFIFAVFLVVSFWHVLRWAIRR